MKKTMIFVSAVVVMAMGAMFVACSNNNAPVNGCRCTMTIEGQSQTREITVDEMDRYGYKTCGDIYNAWKESGTPGSFYCNAY